MESQRIAELLQPFTQGEKLPAPLLEALRAYLEILLRWNAKVNLTSVRHPEQIVTRHFGESLLAARVLRDAGTLPTEAATLADVGSGAGFPGLPIKLMLPHVAGTLIESHSKKATFLREVIRGLQLDGAEVFAGRAEAWGKTANVVTLRAVERFESVLPVAAELVAPRGKLCLLIGNSQIFNLRRRMGDGWKWNDPVTIPQSEERAVLLGERVADEA